MTMSAKRFGKIAILAAGLVLVFGIYAGAAAKEKFEAKFDKVESLDRDGKVIVANVSGKIDIKSWDQAQVKINALKVSEAKTLEKAKENIDKVTIEVNKTGNILRIETKYPEQRFRRGDDFSVRVDYEIWIPDKAGAKLKCVSGNVSVENIGGLLEGDVTSGNLVIAKAASDVDGRCMSGRIELREVAGAVNLKCVSGNIIAEKIKGSLEAETTSGNINVRDISEAKSVRLKILSGNISYEGQIIKDGKYDMEAMSGGIELRIPADSAFDLEAEAFSGHIESDFAVTMSGRISKNDLHGVVNGGGASVHLKTFSGSVRIFKR
jgi:hypothetical protein